MTNPSMTPDKLKQSIVDIIKDQQAPLTYERMFPEYQEWVDALLYLFNSELTRKSEELLDDILNDKFFEMCEGCSCDAREIIEAKRASLPPKPERSEV